MSLQNDFKNALEKREWMDKKAFPELLSEPKIRVLLTLAASESSSIRSIKNPPYFS